MALVKSKLQFGREPTEFTDLQLHKFWSKVDFSGECWVWTACRIKDGYGLVLLGGSCQLAHRISFVLSNGPIPRGLYVLHKCDKPACVNIDHLFLGTQSDNMRDMRAKGRNSPPKTGDQHWTRIHPDKVPRGSSHYLKNHPWLAARGERNGQAKLTSQQVAKIRLLHAAGNDTFRSLGVKFKLDRSTIGDIVHRQIWKHVQ